MYLYVLPLYLYKFRLWLLPLGFKCILYLSQPKEENLHNYFIYKFCSFLFEKKTWPSKLSTILASFVICSYSFYFWLTLFVCIMQVFQPWIQRRRIDYAKHKHVISGVLKHLKMRALGRLLTDQGEPNREVIEKLVSFFYLFLVRTNIPIDFIVDSMTGFLRQ